MLPQQQHFADEWLIDHNGTRAYLVAYPTCKTNKSARAAAARLLADVNVKKYIATKQRKIDKKYEITRERVLQEYAKLAFLDPSTFYDDKGQLLPVHKLPKDTAAALTGMEIKELYRDGKQDGVLSKIKFADKKTALDAIAKMQGYNIEKPASDNHFHITWGGQPQIPEDTPIDVTPSPPLPANSNKLSEGKEE